MITQIYNGKILAPEGKWINDGSIIIVDDKIAEVCDNSRILENVDKIIDAKGGYVMPGGIDMHVHGAGGKDFMEVTDDAFKTVIDTHRRHGTTSIFPTIASAPEEVIRKAADICTTLMQQKDSGVMGLHIEGPYFQPEMVGGQIPAFVRASDPKEYMTLIEDYHCIRRWDASPELPGNDTFGRYVTSKGIVAGIAHTKADYKDICKAHESGYSLATHFYNAMTSSHKCGLFKHEGTVDAIYLIDDINIEIISDGIHVPAPLMKLAHKIKGTERMCLVTDALSCTDSNTKEAFDPRVVIEDGICMLSDRSAIAGSIATMDLLIRTAVKKAGLPLEDVGRMVSETPARIMGIQERKGSLYKHKDADIIIFDKELNLSHVIAMGKEITGNK